MNNSNEPIYDARKLGIPKMLILGIQHMFAMFGATILVPILVAGYFKDACGEPLTRGLTVSVTLFCAGFGTLIFHLESACVFRLVLCIFRRILYRCQLKKRYLCDHECQ